MTNAEKTVGALAVFMICFSLSVLTVTHGVAGLIFGIAITGISLYCAQFWWWKYIANTCLVFIAVAMIYVLYVKLQIIF
jgi:hypothetical protein